MQYHSFLFLFPRLEDANLLPSLYPSGETTCITKDESKNSVFLNDDEIIVISDTEDENKEVNCSTNRTSCVTDILPSDHPGFETVNSIQYIHPVHSIQDTQTVHSTQGFIPSFRDSAVLPMYSAGNSGVSEPMESHSLSLTMSLEKVQEMTIFTSSAISNQQSPNTPNTSLDSSVAALTHAVCSDYEPETSIYIKSQEIIANNEQSLAKKRKLEDSLENGHVLHMEDWSFSANSLPSVMTHYTDKNPNTVSETQSHQNQKDFTLPLKKRPKLIDTYSESNYYEQEEIDKDTLAYILSL